MANSYQRPAPKDFADHASLIGLGQLRVMYKCSDVTVRRWFAETGVPRPKLGGGLKLKQRPADFAVGNKRYVTLARQHGVSLDVIKRWCDELGSERIRASDDIPEDFAERWKVAGTATMAIHYKRSQKTICAWARKSGLIRPKGMKVKVREKAPPAPKQRPVATAANRALGHSVTRIVTPSRGYGDEAANFLQSNRGGGWVVFRSDENGRQDITGKFWRVGRVVCTDAELVERAERRGFDPNAWRRVAA
jgi:hypothetical protein